MKGLFWPTILEMPAEAPWPHYQACFWAALCIRSTRWVKLLSLWPRTKIEQQGEHWVLTPHDLKDMPTLGSFLKPCTPAQYHDGETRPWAHRQAPNCFNGILCSITALTLSHLQKWVITSDRCWRFFVSYCAFISPRFVSFLCSFP